MKVKGVFLTAILCISGTVLAECPSMDVTGDCKVNLADFSVFAQQWLQEGVRPYADLTWADIVSMEADMSTASIDASNGNEFMPGTYFVYKTDLGWFGKFRVENYEPAENCRLTIGWVTYFPNGTIFSQGAGLIIRGTWPCDLDSGQEISAGADWNWSLLTSTTRQLDSRNGAKFKRMYRAKSPAGMAWVYIDDPGVSDYEGYVSKYETTNAQYCEFLNAAKASGDITVYTNNNIYATSDTSHSLPYYNLAGAGSTRDGATNGGAARINWTGSLFTVDAGFENHPVTYISRHGAAAFADYYGWRLPTEWEWQAIADYDGTFIYGTGLTITNLIANYTASVHSQGTTPVGAFGTYGYGLADMSGNVREWTSSLWSPPGDSCVIRGGSWHDTTGNCLVSDRDDFVSPNFMSYHCGFRVCR
jgi:hypothetical protein